MTDMKKSIFTTGFAGLFMLCCFAGCQDNLEEETIGLPAEEGDEILFGTSLNDSQLNTKIIYDDQPVNGAYRVTWENDGSDHIAIYCPQAAQGTLVNYSVMPDQNNPTHSSTVTKLDASAPGLQWGSEGEHHFYGFYPADRVTGTEDGKIRATVPTTQNVTSWNIVEENGGKTYYGKTDTDYAYMWAYGVANKNEMVNEDGTPKSVSLVFHPWMTVLEITIQGPASGTKTVTNVNVRAIEGTQTVLAGEFVCDMTPVEENPGNATPNYEPYGNQGTVRNTISISGYNAETDEFITLGPNDKMVVRAYLLPIDDQNAINARNIQISVATLNGAALTRTLGYSGQFEDNPHTIVPHKVNRVTLPRLVDTGTNYWMSSLDKDIFVTELSIPGSKHSYNTKDNGASPVFQGADIATQFEDGVRAFIAPVDVRNVVYNGTQTGTWPFAEYSHEYISSDLNINGANETVGATITNIAAGLALSEKALSTNAHECAVLIITKPGDVEVSDVTFKGDWEFLLPNRRFEQTLGGSEMIWIEAVANEIQKLSLVADNRIYTGEITANTTLDDVKGKIIIKINYNSDTQESAFAADATYPMLFSQWDGIKNTVPLYWGTMNKTASLQWMYQEATHVGSEGEANFANTAEIKLANVNEIFTKSIDAYQNNSAHDMWFMNDCGGVFSGSVSGTDGFDGTYSDQNDESVIALTRWLNAEVRQTLQTRVENASLGLVFFNFADKQEGSGQAYETNELIQTVIDNNFKFNLRKEGSGTSTANYDASYSAGGNVWE